MVRSTLGDLLPLENAGKLFPSRPGRSTLFAWASRGYRGVVLRTVRSGRQRFISAELAEEFMSRLAALNAQRHNALEAACPPRMSAIERRLDQLGL